jgi:hypothetical protein
MSETSLIRETYASRNAALTELSQDDATGIESLLLGHRVEKVADDHLRLDDGTVLRVVPNDGGCLCGAGDYDLTALNGCDNIITKVEVVDEDREPDEDGYRGEDAHAYRVFVYADNQRVNLLSVEGDDGNGYYGTGYSILVRHATTPEQSTTTAAPVAAEETS